MKTTITICLSLLIAISAPARDPVFEKAVAAAEEKTLELYPHMVAAKNSITPKLKIQIPEPKVLKQCVDGLWRECTKEQAAEIDKAMARVRAGKPQNQEEWAAMKRIATERRHVPTEAEEIRAQIEDLHDEVASAREEAAAARAAMQAEQEEAREEARQNPTFFFPAFRWFAMAQV